jgi:hypothetical protein
VNHSGTKHYSQIASVNVRQVADDEPHQLAKPVPAKIITHLISSPMVRYGGERSVGTEEDDRQVTSVSLTPHSGPLDDGATCGVHRRPVGLAERAMAEIRLISLRQGIGTRQPRLTAAMLFRNGMFRSCPGPPTAAFATIEPPIESLLTRYGRWERGALGLK